MDVIDINSVEKQKYNLIGRILRGEIFIYPTDTIYGIGCDATNYEAVDKIRSIKKREKQPFSIIAPSVEWIMRNCEVDKNAEKWLSKLPGKYTFILRLKNKHAVAKNVSFRDTIGIRIPDNELTKLFYECKRPIITTSVNKNGENYMTSLDDLDPEIETSVDFIIYSGEITGKPSTIVDLTSEEKVIRE